MKLPHSYVPNYFSIDDILATQERVPCKFLCDVPKLGKLNASAEDDTLKAGTSLELPIWLVQPLSIGRTPIVSMELPKVYRETYREILKADACAVDLHKLGFYFYELGAYAKETENRNEVQNILIHTFQTRFRLLMDLAENVDFDPAIQDKLDKLERRLFSEGHNARVKLNKWLVETGVALEAANMVLNHKKRKRVAIYDIL